MKVFAIQLIVFLFLLTGCASKVLMSDRLITPTFEMIETIAVIDTLISTVSPIADPTTTPAPTSIVINACSPLMDYPMDDLASMISNQYNPPEPGSDNAHQGVDFSVRDPDFHIAVKGATVQTILAGDVVMVMKDRFPYGNAIVVETPFQELPVDWRQKLKNLNEPDMFGSTTSLSCPPGWDQPEERSNELSVYILYAHLEAPPEFMPGDLVGCGDGIGSIGDSGNALAPHLHLEMRYGYSAGIKGSMAHYDVSADEQEMSNYCRWRVSGWYRIINPMDMLFINTGSTLD